MRIVLCAAFVRALSAAYAARRADALLEFGRAMTLAQCLTLTLCAAAALYVPVLLYAL